MAGLFTPAPKPKAKPKRTSAAPKPANKAANKKTKAYAARKERERKRQADQSRDGRDIGPIPACTDPALVAKLSKSLRQFCEQCLPGRFKMKWSADHLKAIAKIERAILQGDLFALAMPRGSGKTTILIAAVLWAILHGHRRYVVLIGSDRDAAKNLLAGLKIELETNEKLLALYPGAVWPVRALEGKGNKATGQILEGKRTYIEWKGPRIVFANVPDCPAAGAIIETYGILGRIRGAQVTRADGEPVRPDFFMLDDPQTDRSARSNSQVSRRLNTISGTVLGLAGPGESISGFATVTVIEPDDVADQLLDRDKYADWQGERCKLVYAWPSDVDLWERYATARAEGLRAGRGLEDATAFYAAHRKAMDKGAKPAWAERFDRKRGELSAIQHAYNLRLASPLTFDAEYQNDPQPPELDVEVLPAVEIERKINGFPRGVLSPSIDLVTAFIDVQGQLLYWLVAGWETQTYTGHVLEYGSLPRQTAVHFTLRNISKTLAMAYPRRGLEGRLRQGLWDLLDGLASRRYATPDKTRSHRIDLIGIDAAWGPSTKTVQAVALEHPRSAWILPTFGRGLKPTDAPMAEWKPKPGERKGDFWILRPTEGGGRHLVVDTNAAKSFTNSRLNVAMGDPGALSIYKPELATEHRMLAEHWRAEIPKTVFVVGGRSGEVWDLPPSKPDNHLWDCGVGATVLASLGGAKLPELQTRHRTRRAAARRHSQLKI